MRKKNSGAALGYLFLIAVIVVLGTYLYKRGTGGPLIFSPKSMLGSVWERYKTTYIERDGQGRMRTVDRQRGDITTSEGQSYSMLRSVWLDDKETFDGTWQWTKTYLKRDDGHLFSWLYGPRGDGTYGIVTAERGHNSASDADTDIALALAMAFARWSDPVYLAESKLIISDIWTREVVTLGGRPYMAADNVQGQFNSDVIVNPSYLAPYAYRIFAEIDPAHDWNGLVTTSYEVIESSMRSPLSATTTAGLPPNWVRLERSSGAVRPPSSPSNPGLDDNFGYDALRLPWRLALDWKWNGDERAQSILRSMSFLRSEWLTNGKIYDIYAHDGRPLDYNEVPAMYGGTIGAFMTMDANEAKKVYDKELVPLYNPDSNSWHSVLGYYDDNWAWFGMALYNDELPNLWKTAAATTTPGQSGASSRTSNESGYAKDQFIMTAKAQ